MREDECPDCGGQMEELGRVVIRTDDDGGYQAKCVTNDCEWEFDHPDDIGACRIEAANHLDKEHT